MIEFWNSIYPYLTSFYTWTFFLLGSLIGSFLNVCILRIPEKTFWKNQRSVCPQCEAAIPFYLNLPIISYIILRGKTKCCKKKLSIQYPLVEFFTALVFSMLYWKFPFISEVGGIQTIESANLLRYIHGVTFVSILITCSVIDLRLMIIPDVISIPMILLTPVVVYFHPELSWQSAGIGVLLGGGVLFAVAWLYWILRHQIGMGMGDVKLLAGIGGWLGYQAVLPTIFYGSITGSIVGILGMVIARKMTMNTAIPFGPFLAGGAILHMVFGSSIQEFLIMPH